MFAPLATPAFRRFFLAQCATLLGDAIFLVAIAFAVLEATGSAASLGIVLAAGSALLVVSMLASGVWADRLPRLRIMVASDLVRIASQGTLAVLLFTDRASLWSLIALYGTFSVATAFFVPARSGIVPQLLEPDDLLAANSLLTSAESTAMIIGWAAGGGLVALVGPAGAIAIDALTFAVSAALLLSIGRVPNTASDERLPFLAELREGWREVTSRRWLWMIVLGASLWLLVYEAPMQVVGPLVMQDAYSGAASWGLLGAALASGALAGALSTNASWLRRPMLVSLILFVSTAAMPLLLLAEPPLAVLVGWNVVIGVSFGMFDTVWHGVLQRQIPGDKLSRVSAWDWMGSLSCMPIGFALTGFAVEHLGREPTLVATAVLTLVVTLALLVDPNVRGLDRLIHTAPEHETV